MLRKNCLILLASIVGLSSLGQSTAQQAPNLSSEQLARVQIHAIDGKDGLFVIPGFDGNLSGGNVAVRVTGEGVIIVDNKFPYSFADIMRQVQSVTEQPVRYVLNTHHHSDHAGSNADFMPAAQIIGHENVRVNMIRNQQDGAPPLVFSDTASVFLGDAEAQLHHFGRGHTNGDSVVYFPDLKTIHTGDLFIWGDRLDGSTMAPFFDYGNGGSATEWSDTLDGVLSLDFDTVIPGHGPILNKDDIRTFQDKFDRLILRISRLRDSGVSRNDIANRLDISDLNWPLTDARIQGIYDELGNQ